MLKPGGRIAYYPIYVPPGLSDAEYRRILKFWPSAASGRRSALEMLTSAGFNDVDETDVTKQYKATAQGWLEGRHRHYEGLKQAMGEATLRDKIEEGQRILGSIKDGLLRRSLLTARRPG